MPNKLTNESSPYLRQHQDNPVDWFPWGDEAFRAAKARGVPIFVSIGYSTCHWCHVMAHESFEDPRVAQLLNDNFVSIKVDREERPDIDAVYLQSMQMLGYSTGWPLNVWLTPDGLPFYGGTYFPTMPTEGMPSFTQAILTIRDLWQRDRAKVINGGQKVAKHVIQATKFEGSADAISAELLQRCLRALYDKFDKQYGGFGTAPKFPHETNLEFLLRYYRRTGDVAALSMVELTLGAMAEGGIHDQLGGGFARYSVDAEWHVPHFEKMLYTNAMLLPLFVDTWRLTEEPLYLHTAEGIVRWLESEMRLKGGGFAAATDADSEGVEGKYFIWTAAEVDRLLEAEDADLIKLHFGIADPGSFEGATVLRIVKSDEDLAEDVGLPITEVRDRLARGRQIMLAARKKRVAPGRDDKVIASWNGLLIHALAYAGAALGNDHWIDLARDAARFIASTMVRADGSLVRTWTNGVLVADGVLEDYANVIRGLMTLYSVTGELTWLETSWNLTEYTCAHFAHESGIGFYDTPADTDLFTRPRELTDSALPGGNAVMAEVLSMLGAMRRDEALVTEARSIVESMAVVLPRYPMHTGMLTVAAERMILPTQELILGGNDIANMRTVANENINPITIRGYVHTDIGDWAFLEDKPVADQPAAYWCSDYVCQAPVHSAEALRELLG
ncbi:MAG: thioredoxin domain-containing protein [Thermomicrobiales bacterium]|nr:thioredoxin domain-containing protein [Thermomicrobiales bacterium]